MSIQVYRAVTGGWKNMADGTMLGTSQTRNTLLVGSRVATVFNDPPWNTFAGQESVIGPIQVGRGGYYGSLPTSWSDVGDGGTHAGLPTILSFTSLDGNLTAWCNSIAASPNANALADAGHIWLTYYHEVENGPKVSASTYLTQWAQFHDTVKNIDPRIKVGPIAFTYAYGRGNNATALAGGWIPPASQVDFYGADVYMPYTTAHTELGVTMPASLMDYGDFAGWYNLIGNSGKEIIIPEWGVYCYDEIGGATPDPTQQAARASTIIPEWVSDMRTIGVTAACYWNVPQKNGERGTWKLTDSASQAAYRAIVRAN
jgi:hypothetical protein